MKKDNSVFILNSILRATGVLFLLNWTALATTHVLECKGYLEIFASAGEKIKRYDFVKNRFVFPERKRTFSRNYRI